MDQAIHPRFMEKLGSKSARLARTSTLCLLIGASEVASVDHLEPCSKCSLLVSIKRCLNVRRYAAQEKLCVFLSTESSCFSIYEQTQNIKCFVQLITSKKVKE